MRLFHFRESLIGPLAGWELVRLARRGQASRSRMLVLYFLTIGFIIAPVLWFSHIEPIALFMGQELTVSINDAASFANRFAFILLMAILLAVVAMAPAYAAAAIAEEKDRQTLQMLLTTELSDREIVFGKAFGRFAFVLAAAAGGIPILAASVLFGGVTWEFLVIGAIVIVTTSALTVAIGIHAACETSGLRPALVRAYAITGVVMVLSSVFPPCLCLSPFAALFWEATSLNEGLNALPVGLAYAGAEFFIAIVLLMIASHRLRHGDSRPPIRPAVSHSNKTLPANEVAPLDDEAFDKFIRKQHNPIPISVPELPPSVYTLAPVPPLDDDNPLLWKERHITSGQWRSEESGGHIIANLVFGGMACLAVAIAFLGPVSGPGVAWLLLVAGTISSALFLIQMAIGLSSAIARERQKHTLDALRGLPMPSQSILWFKLRATLERCWWWGVFAVFVLGISFCLIDWTLGSAAAFFVLSGSLFICGLGTYLTVHCLTEIRAFRFMMPAVVVLIGIPVIVANTVDWKQPGDYVYRLAAASFLFMVLGVIAWRRGCWELEHLG